jgi:SSS family solute:Na+ symporter
MITFSGLDWFWAGAFLLLMIGGAMLFYGLARRSESDFFLAGRGLPWWLPASSVFSTHTATDTPVWITGTVYAHGLRGLWYTFFTAWTAIGSFVSARIFRRSLAYTQAEWQTLRFGGLGAELLRGWMAGWQVFMNMFILGWVGMAMGKVGALAFGWPLWVGLVVPTALTAVYTMLAGYWGVVMGDFLQGIVAVFAIVLVSLVGIHAAGGPVELTQGIRDLGEGWMLDPFAFTGWLSGDFPAVWWLTMLVIAVVGGFGMGTSIDWYAEAQRIQSARTVRDASYGLWAGGALTLVRNGFWAASILAFFVLAPGIPEASEYELGWFRLGFELLPVGLVGVFFGAILAIHLSTISSHLNLGALYLTRDLFQRYLKPDASERTLVWVGRIATIVLLIGSFFYGLMMEEITSWLIFALWLMMAGVWLPNILQVVWWRFNAWGYLASWMANLPHEAGEDGSPGEVLRDDPSGGVVGAGPRGGGAPGDHPALLGEPYRRVYEPPPHPAELDRRAGRGVDPGRLDRHRPVPHRIRLHHARGRGNAPPAARGLHVPGAGCPGHGGNVLGHRPQAQSRLCRIRDPAGRIRGGAGTVHPVGIGRGRPVMDRALVTVIGMSIAYLASFVGMGLAWYAWKRHEREDRP